MKMANRKSQTRVLKWKQDYETMRITLTLISDSHSSNELYDIITEQLFSKNPQKELKGIKYIEFTMIVISDLGNYTNERFETGRIVELDGTENANQILKEIKEQVKKETLEAYVESKKRNGIKIEAENKKIKALEEEIDFLIKEQVLLYENDKIELQKLQDENKQTYWKMENLKRKYKMERQKAAGQNGK